MFRGLAIGLIIAPLEGHWGFGNWNKEGTFNHYIHHSKFNWNYGSSPMWDHIMGTHYPKVNRNCQVGSQTVDEQGFWVAAAWILHKFSPHLHMSGVPVGMWTWGRVHTKFWQPP